MAKSQVIEKRRVAKASAPEVVIETAPAESDEPTCQHRWRIESPRGPMSLGRCRICNEEREFRNSTEYVWDNDSGQGYSPWRGVPATAKTHDEDDGSATARTAGGVSLA